MVSLLFSSPKQSARRMWQISDALKNSATFSQFTIELGGLMEEKQWRQQKAILFHLNDPPASWALEV